MSTRAYTSPKRQQGVSTLLVALILLGILTIMTLFTVGMGMFEQRTVGNENRARIVAQVADAGLNHGIEVIKANAGQLTVSDVSGGWGGRWKLCDAGMTAFPCGAEPDEGRRATLYYYLDETAASPTSLIGAGSNVATSNPLNTVGAQDAVGAFSVDYRVGALLCLLATPVAGAPQDPTCQPYEGNYAGLASVTLVSRASLADDPQALADAKVTIAAFRTLGNMPNVPIIASGSINIAGATADVVPNPNAGGPGVALSIWSGSASSIAQGASGGSGDFKTCHLGEFLGNARGASGPEVVQGITICNDCSCTGLLPDKGLISGKFTSGGSGVGRDKSYDILDTVDNTAQGGLAPNTYFPDASITPRLDKTGICSDDSLFEYLFGYDVVHTAGCPTIPSGEAERILGELATPQACSALGPGSSGLYWDSQGCTLPGGDIGSPNNPVFIVADCSFDTGGNTVVYGVVFIRKTSSCPTIDYKSNGKFIIYGSFLSDGSLDLKGTPKFIYNEKVLQALGNSPAFRQFGVVPGSWTDVIRGME